MKRNLTKKIISLVLSVLMLSSCWVFAPIESNAVTAETHEAGFPRGVDPNRGHEGFGLTAGKCVNGGNFSASPSNGLFFLDYAYSKLSFCIQIGFGVSEGATIETSEENAACETLAERVRNSATHIPMTGPRMKSLLRSVLGYGL